MNHLIGPPGWARVSVCAALLAASSVLIPLDGKAESPVKTESFDHDPHWDALNNHIVPKSFPEVTQDFGYSTSNFAGKEKGEMGGQVWRAASTAFYADKIPTRTLNDKLSASGTFTITSPNGQSGLFFGWFNGKQPGGGRPVNSLGLNMNCEKSGGQLAVRMIASDNSSCGTFITPFIPGKYRPTPLQKNVRYTWTLNYDPAANNGNGRFMFSIKGNNDHHEAFERETFFVNVPEAMRKAGATFDHFGLVNGGKAGAAMKVYFDDLEYDGKTEDFSHDPGWDASGNRVTYEDKEPAGAHNFGFNPESHLAGGQHAGEIGGVFWRKEKDFGYYADRVGSLTLNDPLVASGKVLLAVGSPDSGMCLGWFNSKSVPAEKVGNFLGVEVTGPTRVGHYFQPISVTADGSKRRLKKAPVIVPGRVYDWEVRYDPSANGGNGAVRVTLGNDSITLDLKPGDKARGATFDHFGLCTQPPGGSLVKIYFDDLKYTASR